MRIAAVLALSFVLTATVFAQDGFQVPDGDLPEARVGQYRVAFTRSGAAMTECNGQWLFDSGLVFWTKSWADWGTQIRRAKDSDGWTPASDDGQSLGFHGTLFNYNSNPKFTFQQEVKIIPGGLRFHYTVTPSGSSPSDLKGVGVAVQLPVRLAGGGTVALAEKTVKLPSDKGGVSLGSGATNDLKISLTSGAAISCVVERPLSWSITDQRTYKNPTFSLFASDKEAVAALNQGKPAEIAFDLMLAREGTPRVAVSPADPNPRVLVLPDDTTTRGDWIGTYGRTAYDLCAMRSPKSIKLSRNPAWRWGIAGGNPKDSARSWRSAAPADDDRTILWEPDRSRRTPASIDDHGEAYELGAGPDLHLRCAVPRGKHQLSLYFFETDWIQYRAFDISVYTDDAQHTLLAQTSVSDFVKGKYKRFSVQGPARLHIHLARAQSTNVVISGIFLDPME
jgi:hypothetical protein